MTVYRQDANPNATNSELDAKVIVKHPRLTHTQRDELIEQFVEIQVDNMDTQTLVEYVTDLLVNDYSNFNMDEFKDCFVKIIVVGLYLFGNSCFLSATPLVI